MTSANVSPGPDGPGTPPALTPDEVRLFLDLTHIDIAGVVEGGVCPYARDTSIVDVTTTTPRLARAGLVSRRAIVAALSAADHALGADPPTPDTWPGVNTDRSAPTASR